MDKQELEMLEQTGEDMEDEELMLEFDDLENIEDEQQEKTAKDKGEKEEENQAEQQTGGADEMYPEELIVYGQKMQIPLSEVKNYLQKGLAFEIANQKHQERLNRALQDPRLSFVNELAQKAGMEPSEYMASVKLQADLAPLIAQFGEYKNIPENILKMYTENAQINREKNKKMFEDSKAYDKEQRQREEFYSFMENHPEVSEISPEIVKLVSEGMPLEGAFAISKVKELTEKNNALEQELAILKQNEKNKKTALSAAASTAVKADDGWEWI